MATLLNRLITWARSRQADNAMTDDPLSMGSVRAHEQTLLSRAGELGAESGLLAVPLDPAIERVQADLAAAAQVLFAAEESAVLAAQEQFVESELATLCATAGSRPAPAFAPGLPLSGPLIARRTRSMVAAASGVACVGASLQAAGLVGWLGWVVLSAGVVFAIAVAPEAGVAISRAVQAIRAWLRGRRVRAAIAASEARLNAIHARQVQSLAIVRRREAWTELTGRRALAELRLQRDRGAHARSLAG